VNLLELLKQPEGKTLEFKRDLSSPAGVLRTLVAFANTAGGTLLLGVEDTARHVRGVSEPQAAPRWHRSIRSSPPSSKTRCTKQGPGNRRG
jgi:predicted HTH transcriptional regulator